MLLSLGFLEFFRIKTEDDELYEIVMKVLEKLRTDEDQDVRYFAGAKSFEEVSLLSDDAMRNDGQSSEEFDEDSRNDGAESEEKGALMRNTEETILTSMNCSDDDAVVAKDECSKITDEKLECDIEKIRDELQSASLITKNQETEERVSGDDSSTVIVTDMLNKLIDTIEP